MVVVRAATMEDWQVLRDIRLEALRDAPDAFLSTYTEQAAYAEADWRRRISRGGTFFAYITEVNGTEPVGLVGGFFGKPDTVELVSLWVRPPARGLGVGEALVAAMINWASTRNASSVHLWAHGDKSICLGVFRQGRCGFSGRTPESASDCSRTRSFPRSA